MDLEQYIIEAVEISWANEVEVLGTWTYGPTAAGIVYRRTIDPELILGRIFSFETTSADGTLEGFARDIAINLAEPVGSPFSASRRDQHGIVWVAIPADAPLPHPPSTVLQRLCALGTATPRDSS